MHAVIYLRVSTSEQAARGDSAEGYSIPAQRRACLAKALSLDAEVVGEYVDAGESAKTAARPGLQLLLSELATKHVDFVIVHKVDRLARSLHDDVMIGIELQRAGARLVSVTEQIDQTPTGRLLHGIMATFAEYYSRNLAAEALKGATIKAERGGTPYLAPLGYRNVVDRVDHHELRTVRLDPERAPLVRWAFERYASGAVSTYQLAIELKARGLRSRTLGRPLTASAVSSMLRNRYYLGFVLYRGHEYRGQHPPLVSRTTWEAVELLRTQRTQSDSRHRVHHHYLKGLLWCGLCGSRMIYTVAKRRFEYYRCHGRPNGCAQPHVPVVLIEIALAKLLSRLPLDDSQLEELRAIARTTLAQDLEASQAEVERAQSQHARLSKHQQRSLQSFYLGAVSDDVLVAEQARLADELTDVTEHLRTITAGHTTLAAQQDRVLELIDGIDLRHSYAHAPPAVRQSLLAALFQRIQIVDDQTGERDCHGLAHNVRVTDTTALRPHLPQLTRVLLALAFQAAAGQTPPPAAHDADTAGPR